MTRSLRALWGALFGALVVTWGCGGSVVHSPPRSGQVAAQELEELAEFVTLAHPDPFRFVSAHAFQQQVATEAERLRAIASPTELEVGLAFQRVVASLHDSHMVVGQRALQPDREVSILPLAVALVEGNVLVDASPEDVPVGTVVDAIDGHPVAELLEALRPLVVFEGMNQAAWARALERDFALLFHVAFGMRATYTLRLRLPDSSLLTVVSPGLTREAYRALTASRQSCAMRGCLAGAPDALPTQYSVDASTRVVRLPSFGVADEAAFRTRLAEVLADVAQTPQLVLDLRGNEGGFRTYGVELLNRLTDQPYAQWQRSSVRVRRIPAPFRDRVTPLFGASLDLLRRYPTATEQGAHWLEGDPLADRMVPVPPRLPAALVVFVDGLTNSAANELLLALRSVRPDAVIIGEEVGGECERHVGELPVSYTTPVFGMSVLLSLIRIEHVAVPGCELGHGLAPDVEVTYSVADFVSGGDPYVRALTSIW